MKALLLLAWVGILGIPSAIIFPSQNKVLHFIELAGAIGCLMFSILGAIYIRTEPPEKATPQKTIPES